MTAPTILLVEDDPSLRMLTARALQENGFLVRPASAAPEMRLALESGPVDLVLLDGWSELYLPVLEVVEPALRPGALVVADDTGMFPDALTAFFAHVRGEGYRTVPLALGDGLELSCRL